MPPAFILSQNQTLNLIRSKHKPSGLYRSDFVIFADLLRCFSLQKIHQFFIDGNCFLFALLSNKISFLSYSIFNLLSCRTTARRLPSRWEPVYNTTSLYPLSSVFAKLFLIFLLFFARSVLWEAFPQTARLYYHIFPPLVNSFFSLFSTFFTFFSFGTLSPPFRLKPYKHSVQGCIITASTLPPHSYPAWLSA